MKNGKITIQPNSIKRVQTAKTSFLFSKCGLVLFNGQAVKKRYLQSAIT